MYLYRVTALQGTTTIQKTYNSKISNQNWNVEMSIISDLETSQTTGIKTILIAKYCIPSFHMFHSLLLYWWQVLCKSVYRPNAKDANDLIGPDFCVWRKGFYSRGNFLYPGCGFKKKHFSSLVRIKHATPSTYITGLINKINFVSILSTASKVKNANLSLELVLAKKLQKPHNCYTKNTHQDYLSQFALPTGSYFKW